MSTVPYIFADDTGNIPLSQLDANFANAKAAADYVIANVQANITGVGVLANLSVIGNINGTGTTFYTGNGRLLTGIQATTVGVLEELSVLGNVTAGNVSAIGNIRTGNIRTTGQISAFGNVTGSYIKGNGAFLTGIVTTFDADLLTGNTLSSNVIFSNLVTVGTLQQLDVSGNITADNLYGNYLNAPTVQTIDVFTDYVQANVRVDVSGEISATGNITGANYFGNGQALTGIVATSVGTLPSLNVTGNVQAGNLVSSGNLVMGGRIAVVGNVSAVGNVIGNYILGNGAFLSGVTGGTSNAALLTGSTLSSNVTQSSLTTVGTLTTVSVSGNINTGGAIRNPNQLDILTTANNSNILLSPDGIGIVDVTSELLVASSISAVGNIVTTGFFLGNFQGNIVANITNIPGPGGAVVYNDGAGNAAATAGLVYTTTGPNVLTVLGDVVSDGVIANVITGSLATANQSSITSVGTLTTLSVAGNITTTANIAGGFILGNGSQLTGISTGTSNAALLTGTTLSANVVNSSLTSVGTLTAVNTSGAISATGNITGGNLNISGNIVDTGALTIITGTNGNIALAPNGTGIVTTSSALSVSGNINLSGAIRDSTQLDIETTAGNSNINLIPNGTGIVQVTSAMSVAGNLIAPNLVGGGAGTPTISSTSNLVLSAPIAVSVSGGGVFRLPGLTSAQIANITAVNGDMVYNSTLNKFQGYENGAWGNLI